MLMVVTTHRSEGVYVRGMRNRGSRWLFDKVGRHRKLIASSHNCSRADDLESRISYILASCTLSCARELTAGNGKVDFRLRRFRAPVIGGSILRKAYMQLSALASPLDGSVADHFAHWRGAEFRHPLRCRITSRMVYLKLRASRE